ncbi:PREDICTED: E3 ubiquitin-protein ligase ORTHRUS 2-like [Brassica oleracea var. oleracea]|uniref:RING-type E3 ubiquitin transferase n=1 Tax=Brassica oleracea var. oleracea TaxID=109376 RepID=A0A0D3CY27_BRAOL|nr:PREDICTED: E3 ubiquitin-protein ligase ORTHRUS 2-like [Brassica oleracea var. oleracea]
MAQLPCDNDGACLRCKAKPPQEETLTCGTCGTPWHAPCLSSPPETLASTLQWHCPDCSGEIDPLLPVSGVESGGGSDLVAAIRAIEADESLTEADKAKKRQELLSGKSAADEDEEEEEEGKKSAGLDVDLLKALGENLNCSFCIQLPERPVTTPCGHNFCLKCFEKWIGQGKRTCAKCRSPIPPKMASNPRINSSLVSAIRLARVSKSAGAGTGKVFHFISNQDRPDKAFTTERAKKTGKANAASGRIYVTIPPDHFGPIPAENDPVRNQGVLVGESWEDRLECRQWGAHFPHVAGIAGQSNYGAQSVALSGGYEDDEDHGEWFLYTGSGGRDLSGNKRTNKDQSFDQKFEKSNEALRVSCKMGYPVRVVRSHKEKRSAYAPEAGVRYDGVYRIEKCWRKVGIQGSFKVCRYLFVRCDNDPAPWTSDEHGDRPRPLPNIPELKMATELFERKESPSWNFDEGEACWKWMKPPPASLKAVNVLDPEERKTMKRAIKAAHSNSVREKLLKEFSCKICRQVMTLPVTTPCAHNFCKACLEDKFAGQTLVRERNRGGRTLRAQKNVMNCPCCPTDISDFLQNPQVNREVMEVIEKLKNKEEDKAESEEGEDASMEEKAESESEENCETTDPEVETPVVTEEAELPRKRAKLDTDTVVPATMVVPDMK